MIVGVLKESWPGETRVAIVPPVVPKLTRAGLQVVVESGAGRGAEFGDEEYVSSGAKVSADRSEILSGADILPMLHPPDDETIAALRAGQVVVGLLQPLSEPQVIQRLAEKGVTAFALELLPRITRAQAMDVLSSMATIAGYKAVLLAANRLDKMFPLMMTAAGTIAPAKVFVLGAGVAGLQAIASSRRLGAVVRAYDIRPAVREEVESLGAKFVDIPLPSEDAQGEGGYAKAMSEEFYRRQREAIGDVVEESDVVVTTAAVPGKRAPLLITEEMVQRMRAGAVVVDLAVESGGNCALTQPGEVTTANGVHILGPVNIPAQLPLDASRMLGNNFTAFLSAIVKDGRVDLETQDPIVRQTLVARNGEVASAQVRERLAGS